MANNLNEDAITNLRRNILKLADESGYSMNTFSLRCGRSSNYISNVVNGKIDLPKLDSLLAVANECGVELYTLFLPTEKLSERFDEAVNIVLEIPEEKMDLFISMTSTIKNMDTESKSKQSNKRP